MLKAFAQLVGAAASAAASSPGSSSPRTTTVASALLRFGEVALREAARPSRQSGGGSFVGRIGKRIESTSVVSQYAAQSPPAEFSLPFTPGRARLVFAFDATASRGVAWSASRKVTDALFSAVPGSLDVALAVHGGSRLHTFTSFSSDASVLRARAGSIECEAGGTRLLPLIARTLKEDGVRVLVYIGDVLEEPYGHARDLCDALGERGVRLIILHDQGQRTQRALSASQRDAAEIFADLAARTGGCVLPFDSSAPTALADSLRALAVLAVGGRDALKQEAEGGSAGALLLLGSLGEAPGPSQQQPGGFVASHSQPPPLQQQQQQQQQQQPPRDAGGYSKPWLPPRGGQRF